MRSMVHLGLCAVALFSLGYCLAPQGENLVAWACGSGEHEFSFSLDLSPTTWCGGGGCCIEDMAANYNCSPTNPSVDATDHSAGSFIWWEIEHTGSGAEEWEEYTSCEENPCSPAAI